MPIPNVWEALEDSGICPVVVENFVPFPTLSTSHKLNQLWNQAKKNARVRGISFEIGKQDWYEWWGDDIFKRGTGPDDLQMCRFKDEGPYRLDNIYKATQKRNLLDAYHNRVRARRN